MAEEVSDDLARVGRQVHSLQLLLVLLDEGLGLGLQAGSAVEVGEDVELLTSNDRGEWK